MNYSLERYHQRHSDQESQNMSGKNTITNPNQLVLKEGCSPINLFHNKLDGFSFYEKQKLREVDNKESSNYNEYNLEEKNRATNILKKLFTKKFNPGGDRSNWSKVKTKWVDIIDKYNENKNNIINTFVEDHIEQLPNSYNEKYFRGDNFTKKVSCKKITNNNEKNNFNFKEKTMMTNRSSKINFDVIDKLNKTIEKNKSSTNRKIIFIEILFYFSLLIWLIFSIFNFVSNYNQNHDILQNENAKEMNLFTDFYLDFNIVGIFSKLYHNKNQILENMKKGSPSEEITAIIEKELIQQQLDVKNIEDSFKIFEKSYDNFLFRKVEELRLFKKPFYKIFLDKLDWKYTRNDLTETYQESIFDFFSHVKILNSLPTFLDKTLFHNSLTEKNFKIISKSIFQIEEKTIENFNTNLNNMLTNFDIMTYLQIFVFIGLNFAVIFFWIRMLNQSRSIYFLLTKINYADIAFYSQYFKALFYHVKFSELKNLYDILKSFSEKITKSINKRNKIRNCYIPKTYIYKWILKFLVLSLILVIPNLIRNFLFKPKIKHIFHENIFASKIAFFKDLVINQFWYINDFYSLVLKIKEKEIPTIENTQIPENGFAKIEKNKDHSKKAKNIIKNLNKNDEEISLILQSEDYKEKWEIFNLNNTHLKNLNYEFQFIQIYNKNAEDRLNEIITDSETNKYKDTHFNTTHTSLLKRFFNFFFIFSETHIKLMNDFENFDLDSFDLNMINYLKADFQTFLE